MSTGSIQPGRNPRVDLSVSRADEVFQDADTGEWLPAAAPDQVEQLKREAIERLTTRIEKTNKKSFLAKILFAVSSGLIGLGLGLAAFTMGLSLFLAAGAVLGLTASLHKMDAANSSLETYKRRLNKLMDPEHNHRWTEETLRPLIADLDSLDQRDSMGLF